MCNVEYHNEKKSTFPRALCPHLKPRPSAGHPHFLKAIVEEQTAAQNMSQPLKACQGRIPKTDLGLGSTLDLSHQLSVKTQKAKIDSKLNIRSNK